MNIKTVISNSANPSQAVAELKNQLFGFDFHTLIFFASHSYNAKEMANQLKQVFADKDVFGASSYSEFFGGNEEKDSIVAMAINRQCVEDIKVEVITNISERISVTNTFASYEKHFGIKMEDADYKQYVGLILIDGLTNVEERIIDKIGDRTNVFFIGGSASDNMTFTHTYVYANGEVYENAAVLALLKMKTEFALIKTQSVEIIGKEFKVTKATPEKREINEIEGIPAAEFLSSRLNVATGDLKSLFINHPVGLCVDDDIFIRELNDVKADGSVTTFCSIEEGLHLSLLKAKDMVIDTKNALLDKERLLGSISGVISFNCMSRTLQLYRENRLKEYCANFERYNSIGFSTYGEIYLGHMNQTATMLVFK